MNEEIMAGVPTTTALKFVYMMANGRPRFTLEWIPGSTATERKMVERGLEEAVAAGHPHTEHLTKKQRDELPAAERFRVEKAIARRGRRRGFQKHQRS